MRTISETLVGVFVGIGVHNISWCDHVFSVSDDLHTWSAPYTLGGECAGAAERWPTSAGAAPVPSGNMHAWSYIMNKMLAT